MTILAGFSGGVLGAPPSLAAVADADDESDELLLQAARSAAAVTAPPAARSFLRLSKDLEADPSDSL
jgi:hypothetical protein